MNEMRPLWLDIARLVERACVGTLTGIDRVELAYAEALAAMPAECVRFVMLGRWSGRLRGLPHRAVLGFLERLRLSWRHGRPDACRLRAAGLLTEAAAGPFVTAPGDSAPPVYLVVSHRHLHREAALAGALRWSGAVFVPLIHDLIPLAFPEYGRPGEATRHRCRMATVARLADGVVVNSAETGAALAPYLPVGVRTLVAPLGVSLPASGGAGAGRVDINAVAGARPRLSSLLSLPLREGAGGRGRSARSVRLTPPPSPLPQGEGATLTFGGIASRMGYEPAREADARPEAAVRPYFLCVGTIEPRKNHLLLLHVWRRLVASYGNRAPRLLIVGSRGWENENVVDLLDRCAALRGHVEELGPAPDTDLAALLRGARALLMPSFAEGFGLPVAEALSQGTPVICSDLPALREVGQGVPEYLDPLHALAWQDAVRAYAVPRSPRREAQLARLPRWRGTSWEAHVASVLAFAAELPRRGRVGADDGVRVAADQPGTDPAVVDQPAAAGWVAAQ